MNPVSELVHQRGKGYLGIPELGSCRVLNVNGQITDGPKLGLLRGPVDQWVDELTDLAVGYGFDTFIFWGEGDDQLSRFAEEVVPAVRSQIALERGRS